jgi:Uma2 family endonuclease
MATALEPQTARALEGEHRFFLPGIGWEGYEALLKMIDDGHTRVTYDAGNAELMSPRYNHENFKKLFARLIEELTIGLNIPCEPAGSTIWKKPILDKGLEADECYYLAHAERIIGRDEIDLDVDPPPDLAVEIEISRSALNRMGIYAALGVPEVWRFNGEFLRIEQLQPDRTYRTIEASPALPFITPDEIVHWVQLGRTMGKTAWGRLFREWVRDELSPRR